MGRKIVQWNRELRERWTALRFGEVAVRTDAGRHLFEAGVQLAGLDPGAVRVELWADGIDGGGPIRQEMKPDPAPASGGRPTIYRASVPATRLAPDYTPRIIPRFAGVAVPLEVDAIVWQR